MTWTISADYNATPGSNTTINGINVGEGCNASGINDAIRQMMADLAVQFKTTATFLGTLSVTGAISGGSFTTSGGFTDTSFGATGSFSSSNIQTNASNFIVTVGGTGGVLLTSGGTSWSAVSDERVKTTLTPFKNPLAMVASLRTGTGRYIRELDGPSHPFLIAQDVRKVLPEAVDEDDRGFLSLRYTDLVPLLVAAITELRDEVATLKAAA